MRPLVDKSAYCAAIRLVAIEWSALEHSVHCILWKLAGLNARTGRCITQYTALGIVWDSILSLSFELKVRQEQQQAIKTLQSQCEPLRLDRNKVVHALWGVTATTNLSKGELTAVVATARGKLKIENKNYSVEDIYCLAEQISKLSLVIATFSTGLQVGVGH